MLNKMLALSAALLLLPVAAVAQSSSSSSSFLSSTESDGGVVSRPVSPAGRSSYGYGPFSHVAIGAGVSPLGVGVEVTTSMGTHLNLRARGNGFPYSTTFTTNGFNAKAKLNLASAGIAGDIYPFHNGFRVSPGVLFLNNNKLTAASTVAGGTSFTLNGDTFYSATANSVTGATPLNANARLGLNTTKPAFTITTGWGNTIPHNGNHLSFPFEVGAAFIGSPSLTANLNGWACYDPAQTECTNVASTTNPIALQIQGDMNAQIAKWKNNLDPLKTFPIVSFGVDYSFGNRGVVR